MKRTDAMIGIVTLLIVFYSFSGAFAEDAVYYDGSSQMYRAFVLNTAEIFTKETGIRVYGEEHTSGDAVPALISGKCNVGGVARKMNDQERSMGKDLEEILICKDHMAVVAYGMDLDNGLTMEQLQNIFSGTITDWKEVGGKPGPIRVVIPSVATACHKNFKKNVMGNSSLPLLPWLLKKPEMFSVRCRLPDRLRSSLIWLYPKNHSTIS